MRGYKISMYVTFLSRVIPRLNTELLSTGLRRFHHFLSFLFIPKLHTELFQMESGWLLISSGVVDVNIPLPLEFDEFIHKN